jgi:hypothetical protein
MSQNWIFINSPLYRRFIASSRERPWLFWGATAGLFGAAAATTSLVMGATNPNWQTEHERDVSAQVAKMPMHAQVQARHNREQLRAMIKDVTSGDDRARYRAMLDGKIHGTTHGTSLRPLHGGSGGGGSGSSSGSVGQPRLTAGAAGKSGGG